MRHRLLFLYLDRFICERSPLRVLHFAPEAGIQRRLRDAPNLDYVSGDLDSRFAMVNADLTAIRFADESSSSSSAPTSSSTSRDDRKPIHELFRVLRRGGEAVVQVPVKGETTFEDASARIPAERASLFGQFDHVRICGRDYVERLEEAGFDVSVEDWAEGLDEATRARLGVRTGEPFFLWRKRARTGAPSAGRESRHTSDDLVRG